MYSSLFSSVASQRDDLEELLQFATGWVAGAWRHGGAVWRRRRRCDDLYTSRETSKHF